MILAALKKEFSLVFRDLHSIMVLFFMPTIFIVIMSLAMQNQFSEDSKPRLSLYVLEESASAPKDFTEQLITLPQFEVKSIAASDREYAFAQLKLDKVKALVIVPDPTSETFDPESFQGESAFDDAPVELWFSPQLDKQSSLLIEAAILEHLVREKIPTLLTLSGVENSHAIAEDFTSGLLTSRYIYERNGNAVTPSSVQQNVPAWLIFSMFFVVIPIATTLITERQHGTLVRLRTMNVSMPIFLLAKTFPYLVINQIQLIFMLLIGAYLIPLLGGDALNIDGSYPGLAIMALTTGYAAVGYGLFIAVIVKTTEHATILGGVGNILLGAIGGIMVPKFIMPDYLQLMTNISPMAWALDGFLDIFLRNGGVMAVLAEAAALLGFGSFMLLLAIVIFNRKHDSH